MSRRRRKTLSDFNQQNQHSRRGKQGDHAYIDPGVSTPPSSVVTDREAFLPHRRTSEPVVGWRAWRLRTDENGEPVLASVAAEVNWEGPVHRADNKPGVYDNYGVHAFRLVRMNKEYNHAAVEGEVLLYGKVIVFEKGIRAEAAMIRRLVIHPGGWSDEGGVWWDQPGKPQCRVYTPTGATSVADNRALLAALAKRYDCDVSFMPRLDLSKPELLRSTPSLILCPHCKKRTSDCRCSAPRVELRGGSFHGVHIHAPDGIHIYDSTFRSGITFNTAQG